MAKLVPPIQDPAHVRRADLIASVGSSLTARVLLVRAPAGYGKTTLMGQLRQSYILAGRAVAWLNLCSADNDVSRFVSFLTAAIDQISSETLREVTRAGAESHDHDTVVSHIIDRLARSKSSSVLFLDDFDVLCDVSVIRLIGALIDQLPPFVQIVIGSRREPDLVLSNLRGRGQLVELGVSELRFSQSETRDFFTARGCSVIDREKLSKIYVYTEGWVAILWLIWLELTDRSVLHGGFDFRLRASDAISAYLVETVLPHQSIQVRRFLECTCILRDLNPSLCRALVPDMDPESLLTEVVSTGIPVMRIAGEVKTYRYIPILAEYLKAQLRRKEPSELARLHRLASEWYTEQNDPIPAIEHALASSVWNSALGLLDRYSEQILAEGRLRLLARWYSLVPLELLRGYPKLRAIHLFSVALTQGVDAAAALLSDWGGAAPDDPESRGYVMQLRTLFFAMRDEVEDALGVGRQCVAQLPTTSDFADAILLSTVAGVYVGRGDFDGARVLVERARRVLGDKLPPFSVMYIESVEGLIDLQEGRFRQARARLRASVEVARRKDRTEFYGNAWAGVLYACAAYEANEIDRADRALCFYAPLVRESGLADLLILAQVTLGRIALVRGDVDTTFLRLTDLEYMGRERKLPRVVVSAQLERARILLLQGHTRAASNELGRAADAPVWAGIGSRRLIANELEDIVIGKLRWEAVAGTEERTLTRLEEAINEAAAGGRHYRAMKLRLLYAIALARHQRRSRSESVFEDVLIKSYREGFVRLIADEGDAVRNLLGHIISSPRGKAFAAKDNTYAEYLRRVTHASGVSNTELPLNDFQQPNRVEALTRKEADVLALASDGHADAAIAERLCVSVNTVRTHLRNVYAKLGVRSRMQAVVVARQVGLM